jgi:hypothetical protein
VNLRRRTLPYGLLGPGLIWLILFFAVPMYFMGEMALRSGALATGGFSLTWEWSNFPDALDGRGEQIVRTFLYSGAATVLALLISARLRDRGKGRPSLAAASPLRRHRSLLHHLPDPHDRLEDDPRRRQPDRRRAPVLRARPR